MYQSRYFNIRCTISFLIIYGWNISGCKWNSFNTSWCNNSWCNVGGWNISGLTLVGVISIGVTLVGAIVVSVL